MSVEHLEFLVEEVSMEAFLRNFLPRILGDQMTFEIHPYQGKSDLVHKLPARLRGYAGWLPDSARIIVVVDRDDDDCLELKRLLEATAKTAGLRTPCEGRSKDWQIVNRIAIEELEAWYFGDWEGVRAVYPRVKATLPAQAAYRDPDAIVGGTWEAFERVMQRGGYFAGGLRKTEAARELGATVEFRRSRSRSFQVLCNSLIECADGSPPA